MIINDDVIIVDHKKVDNDFNATSHAAVEEQLANDLHVDKADTLDAFQWDEPQDYWNSHQASEEEQKLYNSEFEELNQDSQSCCTEDIQQVGTATSERTTHLLEVPSSNAGQGVPGTGTQPAPVSSSNPDTNPIKFIPIYEVIKIVDKVADVLVQQFNNKIAELEARITEQNTRLVELEAQLASLQNYQLTNNDYISEDLLQNLTDNITSKIVGFSSKQNGKGAH